MAQVNVVFLDVGQGDGTMITAPSGELVLVDLGSKKNAEIAGGDAVLSATAIIEASMRFRNLNQPRLDHLFLTHGDEDHYNLLTTLFAFVDITIGPLQIGEIAIGGEVTDYDDELQEELLLPAALAHRLTVFENADHDQMALDGTVAPRWTLGGGVKVYLLSANYPTRDGPTNPKSMVLLVEYGNPARKVILTGDAERPTEAAILGYYGRNLGFLQSFGLKLGHHGSQAGSSIPWITAVKQLANFASSDMLWAHPYCATLSRIAETVGPGVGLYDHPWLCGAGAGERKVYRNFTGAEGFYTTMASMDENGLVQGVQYQLSIADDGAMQLIDTLGHDSGPFIPPGRASAQLQPAATWAGC